MKFDPLLRSRDNSQTAVATTDDSQAATTETDNSQTTDKAYTTDNIETVAASTDDSQSVVVVSVECSTQQQQACAPVCQNKYKTR